MPEELLPSDSTLRVPSQKELGGRTLRVPAARRDGLTTGSGPENEGQNPGLEAAADATLQVNRAGGAPLPKVVPCGTLTNQKILPLGYLAAGSVICGDCLVKETVRPQETLRPGLYDCEAPEGRVMVKVAAMEHPPVEEMWLKLPSLIHPCLVRTHRVDRERGFCVEVQEYCEGGTLDACVPRDGKKPLAWETIEKSIVTSFQAGIAYLHANGIVHRDVKPKNLYLRRSGSKVSVVIGDFDISSIIEADHTSRDTSRGAGTHFYMAPEAFPRFVDPGAGRAAAIVSTASDYYSFGVVLVELVLGTTALHSGRWSDVYDFYMSGGRLEIPSDIPPRARELMQGLLIRNRRTRWGEAELRRWVAGGTTEDDRQRIRDDIGFELVTRAARPYNVFPSGPTDVAGLAKAMAADPVLAEEELMAGDVLVNWLGELDMLLAREVRRDREEWRKSPRMAVMCVLMRMDPTLPFTVAPGKTVSSLEEFGQKTEQWVKNREMDLGLVVSASTLVRLEAWLRLKANPELMSAQAVADLRTAWWGAKTSGVLSPVNQRIAWEELCWMLDPLRPFYLSKGVAVRTPAEVARFCYGALEDWENGVPALYRAGLDRWKEGWLTAWLRQRARDATGAISPVVNQIDALREKREFAPEATWEVVLRLLDPDLPRVQIQAEPSEANQVLLAEWGTTTAVTVNYRVVSPGIPFGVWKLLEAPPGMVVEPITINLRQGGTQILLNTANGLEPGSAGRCGLSLDTGGNCSIKAPLSLYYRVKLPDSRRNEFVRNGVLLGAGIAGGSRLIAFLCTGVEWRPDAAVAADPPVAANPATGPPGVDPVDAAGNTAAPLVAPAPAAPDPVPVEPPMGYLGAATALVLGIVVGIYVWLDAIKKHAHR